MKLTGVKLGICASDQQLRGLPLSYVFPTAEIRAPTLGLYSAGRVRLITRRLWTDIMTSDIRLGVGWYIALPKLRITTSCLALHA